MLSCFSHVWHFVNLCTVALQAPLSWDSPGKNTGVGWLALLQEIFPTQGSNPQLEGSCIGGGFMITAEPVGKPVLLLTHYSTFFNIYIANPSNHLSTHLNFTFQSKLQTFLYFPQSTSVLYTINQSLVFTYSFYLLCKIYMNLNT